MAQTRSSLRAEAERPGKTSLGYVAPPPPPLSSYPPTPSIPPPPPVLSP